jgi:glycosyltransferase involved in cell wall biosynthesis
VADTNPTDSERAPGRDPGSLPSLPSATIIVPCRNEAAHIQSFLSDLERQLAQVPGLEIIIADGMSDDGTREALAAAAATLPTLRVIDNPKRHVSPGLNAAIMAARGEYIIRLDVHTRYADDYCRQCLEVALETGAANVGGAARTEAFGYMPRVIAAAYGSPFAVGGARFHFADYEGEVDTVTYGCWPRQTLIDVGMFDEALVRNQDDELNFRLKRAGLRVWQSARIRSWYRPRGSLSQLFRQYYQYGYWKVAVIRKHGGAASWRHYIPATFVGAGLLLVVGSLVIHPLAWLLAAWAATYLAFVLAGSLLTARACGWGLLPMLPAAFCSFHWGYGLGFLRGLLSRPGGPVSGSATSLSR